MFYYKEMSIDLCMYVLGVNKDILFIMSTLVILFIAIACDI